MTDTGAATPSGRCTCGSTDTGHAATTRTRSRPTPREGAPAAESRAFPGLRSLGRRLRHLRRAAVGGWLAVVLSAMLANWMVDLAFVFATMAQNVWSKFVPLALAVLLFEAANFQHSLANMAYFSLVMPGGGGADWADAIWWNLAPAALGNIVGGALLVPFWYAVRKQPSRADTGEVDRSP